MPVRPNVSIRYGSSQMSQLVHLSTTRKDLKIRIAFAKGVSHSNWYTGKSTSVYTVAHSLINGNDWSKTPRPIFDNYRNKYRQDIEDIVEHYLVHSYTHYSWQDRLMLAGEAIKEDLVDKTMNGRLGLSGLRAGRYLKHKSGTYGGAPPFVASGELLSALEVEVE